MSTVSKTFSHFCKCFAISPFLNPSHVSFSSQQIPAVRTLVQFRVLPLVSDFPNVTPEPFTKTIAFRFITLPFLAREPKAIEAVQIILESVLLRREKNMRDSDGRRIVELPPKEVTLRVTTFFEIGVNKLFSFRSLLKTWNSHLSNERFTTHYTRMRSGISIDLTRRVLLVRTIPIFWLCL